MPNIPIIELRKISKSYFFGKKNELAVLKNIDLKINQGEFISIMGPSGSGKSTLLNIIGLLDTPTGGQYILDRKVIDRKTKPSALAKLRLKKIGFVFQTFNLLARTTVMENVEIPLVYAKTSNRQQKALALLEKVGLSARSRHLPNELSGGESQRVAIARALANEPEILLADEPTGNLDSQTGAEIINLIKQLNKEGMTIVLVTHDHEIAKTADRLIKMKDGYASF